MNKHSVELRVRYQETDQMGVVYYANYLVWFEIARTEFFRARGVEYRKIEEQDKIYIPVVEAQCRYRSPLRYDDLVTITTELTNVTATRITFGYEVKKNGKITATGSTRHAFVDKKGTPIPIPAKVKKAFRTDALHKYL
ncbi:MAG: acyl-CoA thioesterase [Candidatus Makaraimicrobium thalassicum]|nr:MAG: acyl-CoA thioesterase [Candidatus Omnitrophota bacterium]